jgi:hypothetical protein
MFLFNAKELQELIMSNVQRPVFMTLKTDYGQPHHRDPKLNKAYANGYELISTVVIGTWVVDTLKLKE